MKNLLSSDHYLNDAIFRKFIQEHLDEIRDNRQKLIDDTQVYSRKHHIAAETVLKRDSYSRLREKGIMTVDGVINEAGLLMNKKSSLPSMERRFLGNLLSSAMSKTILFYESKK